MERRGREGREGRRGGREGGREEGERGGEEGGQKGRKGTMHTPMQQCHVHVYTCRSRASVSYPA